MGKGYTPMGRDVPCVMGERKGATMGDLSTDQRRDIGAMAEGYLITALWSSTDESTPDGGEPLDAAYGIDDIDDESRARAMALCAEFYAGHSEQIIAADNAGQIRYGPDFTLWEHVGHDLWLTRNGHGAGFWDGDYPEPLATVLTDGAKGYGEAYPYPNDDGGVTIDG